jgi:Skp family chaperone for outer membrane proteins
MSRLDIIKAAAIKQQEKKEMDTMCTKLDARKKELKREKRMMKKLNKSIAKAERLSPGSLDLNRRENLYYSDKEISAFLEGSSIMETYNATKDDWD